MKVSIVLEIFVSRVRTRIGLRCHQHQMIFPIFDKSPADYDASLRHSCGIPARHRMDIVCNGIQQRHIISTVLYIVSWSTRAHEMQHTLTHNCTHVCAEHGAACLKVQCDRYLHRKCNKRKRKPITPAINRKQNTMHSKADSVSIKKRDYENTDSNE